jgi:hypothetical protein
MFILRSLSSYKVSSNCRINSYKIWYWCVSLKFTDIFNLSASTSGRAIQAPKSSRCNSGALTGRNSPSVHRSVKYVEPNSVGNNKRKQLHATKAFLRHDFRDIQNMRVGAYGAYTLPRAYDRELAAHTLR